MKKVILGGIAALALIGGAAVGQQPTGQTPPAATEAPTSSPGKYVGVASCVNSGCHGSTEPLNATRALQNEYYTWLNRDRHAQAYNVLFSERSARVGRNMRLRGKVYEEKICLDCHTTYVTQGNTSGQVDFEDGVQCEACHGPASGWRDEHTQVGWTHEQSVARGMIDLRSVTRRGQQCVSCHLGNANKEVDHELIASGHPILAFELDNYTESMPPHWTPGRESHGLRAWSVGQVVKFRQSLDNVARHAKGQKWPEFADMSCFNCHHDLKASTWRQERGWPDRAGLPTWSPQHYAMLRLLIGKVSPSAKAELEAPVNALALAVARMGDRDAVVQNAEKARAIVDRLLPQMERMNWSDSDVKSLMSAILNDRDFILKSDVHAAEQAALALQSLNSTMTRRDRSLLRSNLTRSIDGLFEELENRDDYEPSRFVKKMDAIKAAM